MGKRGTKMKSLLVKTGVVALVLAASGTALAESNFGVGAKAGTLGFGIEGTWRPVPMFDIRLGANTFDYDRTDTFAGVEYNDTLILDTVYATANFKFPLSPFRITAGAYSNGNELTLTSAATPFDIGGSSGYSSADIGTVTATASFPSTSPYLGVGFDFSVMGKVGLNLDFGVLWQGEPTVTMTTDGLLDSINDPTFLGFVETERQDLQDDLSSFKAWPVISLGFVYNF